MSSSSSSSSGGNSTHESTEDESGLQNSPYAKAVNRPPPSRILPTQGSLSTSEGLEQAEVLKSELDRVNSGISLLGQSMERLHDVIRLDSRCCGSVIDTISIIIGMSSAPSDRSPRGYATVSMEASFSENSSNRGGRAGSARNPIVLAGGNGRRSGIGRETSTGIGSFSIESLEEEED
jgi:hypothetical protein